jgi:hypothetical protein
MRRYTPANGSRTAGRGQVPPSAGPGERAGLPGLEAECQTRPPAKLSARPLLGQTGVTGAHLPVRSRTARLTLCRSPSPSSSCSCSSSGSERTARACFSASESGGGGFVHALATSAALGRRRSSVADAAAAGARRGALIAPIERITFHSLRRTFASLRCACGDDIRYTSGQLGHEDPRFSLRVYTQATKRRERLSGPHLRAYERALEWARMGTSESVVESIPAETTESPV